MLNSYGSDLADELVVTLEDNIKKFKRYGKITNKTVRNLRGEEGKIGVVERDDAETAYVIFYSDGTYDRFENVHLVHYRDGWYGPDLLSGELQEPKIEIRSDRLPEAFENLITMKPVAKKRPGRPRKVVDESPTSSAFLATVTMAEKAAKINKKIASVAEKEAAKRKRISTKAVATKRAKASVAKVAVKTSSKKGFAEKSTKSRATRTVH